MHVQQRNDDVDVFIFAHRYYPDVAMVKENTMERMSLSHTKDLSSNIQLSMSLCLQLFL